MLLKKSFLLLLVLPCSVTPLLAQSHQPVEKTGKIVITASRTEKFIEDAPVKTEIITSAMLDKVHATNLEQALRHVPGLLLQEIHGKTGSEAWIQGISSDRVLVLVNGKRVSASTGSTVDLTQVAVSDVLQIEVIKGAASALYGSSAMGGVINVITKTPAAGWHGKLQAQAGSYGSHNAQDVDIPASQQSAEISYQGEKLTLRSFIDFRRSDGYLIENEGSRISGEDGYKFNGNLSASYQFSSQLDISADYRRYKENHHKDVIIPGVGPGKNSELARSEHYSLASSWKTESHSIESKWFYEDFVDITSQSNRQARIQSQGAEIVNNIALFDGNQFTAGFNYNYDKLSQARNLVTEIEGGEKTRDSYEVFLQYDFWSSEELEWLPGFRYQKDSDFGTHIAPKISLLKTHNNAYGEGKFRLGLGSGYRVPNLKERYFRFDHSNLGYMVLGNPELTAERSYSTQVGYDFYADNDWFFSVNIFNNQIRDLIETISQGFEDGIAIHQYQNINKAVTRGIELTLDYPLSENLQFNSSYNYLKSEDRSTGDILPKRPRHTAKITFDWSHFDSRANLLLFSQYQSKAKSDITQPWSPSWVSWDIKYNFQLTQSLKLFSGIDNIFNRHRDPQIATYDLRPVPGRYIYGGFKWNL